MSDQVSRQLYAVLSGLFSCGGFITQTMHWAVLFRLILDWFFMGFRSFSYGQSVVGEPWDVASILSICQIPRCGTRETPFTKMFGSPVTHKVPQVLHA